MKARNHKDREALILKQEQRQQQTLKINPHIKTSKKRFWNIFTGRKKRLEQQRKMKTYDTQRQNQKEMDRLIFRQLAKRQVLQVRINELEARLQNDKQTIIESVLSKDEFEHYSTQQQAKHERQIIKQRGYGWGW